MQKHISLAETALTAHISNNLTIDINSQDPYLLGFDSNLVPNFSTSGISAVSWRGFQIFGRIGEICLHFSVFLLGIPPNIWEIHFDWSYFLQDTAGLTANTEYLDYSLDLERITQIIGKITRRSSEMAKIAIPAQEISKNLEKLLYFCVR